jgi:hypothetical protein
MSADTTKSVDFTNVPNAQFASVPITSPKIIVKSTKVSPGFVNLACKDQVRGTTHQYTTSVHRIFWLLPLEPIFSQRLDTREEKG